MKNYLYLFLFCLLLAACVPAAMDDSDDVKLKNLSQTVGSDKLQSCALPGNVDPEAIIRNLFAVFLDPVTYADGNIDELKALFSDDLTIVHQGPLDPKTPFYNIWNGKNGLEAWVWTLLTTGYFVGFDVKDMVVDGNKVTVHVTERVYILRGQELGPYESVENFHTWYVNSEGLITGGYVISESYTVWNANYDTWNQGAYETKYKIPSLAEGNNFGTAYNKAIAYLFVEAVKYGRLNALNLICDQNVELAATGDESIGWVGKFSGIQEVKNHARAIKRDSSQYQMDEIVGEGSRVDIRLNFTVNGVSCKINYYFLLNSQGKIEKIYLYSDSYGIWKSYQ